MKKILSLVMVMLLATSSLAYAASPVTKEYTFTTTNKDYANFTLQDVGEGDLAEVEKDIKVEGKRYKAVSISFKEVERKEPVKRTKTYTALTEKKVPKTLTLKSGDVLKLIDAEYKEETQTRAAATGSTTYTGTNTKPDAPATKNITAELPDGSTITVTGHLQSVEKTGSSYSKPFTVTAKFTGDADVAYYKLGDTKIPNNPKSPVFDGYEKVLLKHLGYDPSQYTLTAGKWTSDYTQENGQTVRYAEFTGMQSTANWTAYYTESLTADSPQLTMVTGYSATAEYSNSIDTTSFEVIATVTYEPEHRLLPYIIGIGVGVLILSLVIVIILQIIKRKKGETADENSY